MQVTEILIQIAECKGLTPCERDVIASLLSGPYVSRQNPISIAKMQIIWRTTTPRRYHHERKVREAVKHLVEHHGVPIGSAHTRRAGFFLMVSEEDIAATEAHLLKGTLSMLRRLRAINPKSDISRRLCGQLEIKEGNHEQNAN